ncbi:MAG: hypothetical protein WCL19_06770 [Verrucomicrobiota bacterium]
MKHLVGSRFKNAATKGGSVPKTTLKASKAGELNIAHPVDLSPSGTYRAQAAQRAKDAD